MNTKYSRPRPQGLAWSPHDLAWGPQGLACPEAWLEAPKDCAALPNMWIKTIPMNIQEFLNWNHVTFLWQGEQVWQSSNIRWVLAICLHAHTWKHLKTIKCPKALFGYQYPYSAYDWFSFSNDFLYEQGSSPKVNWMGLKFGRGPYRHNERSQSPGNRSARDLARGLAKAATVSKIQVP